MNWCLVMLMTFTPFFGTCLSPPGFCRSFPIRKTTQLLLIAEMGKTGQMTGGSHSSVHPCGLYGTQKFWVPSSYLISPDLSVNVSFSDLQGVAGSAKQDKNRLAGEKEEYHCHSYVILCPINKKYPKYPI